MRYILTIMLSLLLLVPCEAKKEKGEAVPTVKENIYNFGIINPDGGAVSHEFEITNTGTSNLVIIDARADCGCTKPEYPKNPIAPGKTAKIKVTFQPLGQLGSFKKAIDIKTNGRPSKVRLRITGTVNPNKAK